MANIWGLISFSCSLVSAFSSYILIFHEQDQRQNNENQSQKASQMLCVWAKERCGLSTHTDFKTLADILVKGENIISH